MADRAGHSLEDTFRRHDAAFMGFWNDLRVDYGDMGLGIEDNVASLFAPINRNDLPILKVFATPQRAIARVVDRLVHTGWIAGADTAAQAANAETLRSKAREDFAILPLPLLTVVRDDPVQRNEDAGMPKVFRKQCFDEANSAFQTQRWPGSWDIPYRVVVWTIKRYTMEFIREWVLSQIGRRGAGETELFIPVQHQSPWGEIRQTLTLDAINDQSELEGGENARILRVEFSFRLKGWHFKRPEPVAGVDPTLPGASEGQVPPVQDLTLQEAIFQPGAPVGTNIDPLDFGGDPALVEPNPLGLNLFSFFLLDTLIPTQWPKAGNATVRRGNKSPLGILPHPTLRAEVTDPSDEVLVSNRAVPLDSDSLAILTMGFDYMATEPAQIVVAHKAPGEGQPFANSYVQPLPQATLWTHGQFFALLDEATFSVTVAGSGTLSRVDLSQINLRWVRSPDTKTTPDSSVPGAGQTVHSFSGLEDRPHLAVVVYDTGASADSIDVNGESFAADPAEQTVGLVAIFTPSGGTATVTVPDTIPTQQVYVMRYRGFWDGTAV